MSEDGSVPAGESSKKGFFREILPLLGKIPIVGSYFDALDKVSDSALGLLLLIAFFVIIYPLISFFVVLGLLGLAPVNVQTSVRGFVLESLGVDGATDEAINKNNKLIDAEVPLSFTPEGHETYYQVVSSTQKMDFDGVVRIGTVPSQPAGCANLAIDPSLKLGDLNVLSTNSSYQAHYPVRAITEGIQSIKSVDEAEWKQFAANTTGSMGLYPLSIHFSTNPAAEAQPFFRCYTVRLWINMTIYKPQLDARKVGG